MPEKLGTCAKCGAPLDQPAAGRPRGLLRPTRFSAPSAAYRLSRSRRPARPFLDLVLLRLLHILAALFSHCVPPSAFVRIVARAGALDRCNGPRYDRGMRYKCAHCGKPYEPTLPHRQKYCCSNCRSKAFRHRRRADQMQEARAESPPPKGGRHA